MTMYLLLELNHRTKQWIGIESDYNATNIMNRLEYYRTNNGDKADYRVEFIPGIPA